MRWLCNFPLLALLLTFSLPASAGEEPTSPPKALSLHDLATMKIDEEEFGRLMSPENLKRDVPDLHVVMAVLWHETLGVTEEAKESGRNYLRLFVLGESDSKVHANRRHVREQGLSADFQNAFDSIIDWKRQLSKLTPADLHNEAERIRRLNDSLGLSEEVGTAVDSVKLQ